MLKSRVYARRGAESGGDRRIVCKRSNFWVIMPLAVLQPAVVLRCFVFFSFFLRIKAGFFLFLFFVLSFFFVLNYISCEASAAGAVGALCVRALCVSFSVICITHVVAPTQVGICRMFQCAALTQSSCN